jgi:pepF/M3 family oligoendopeptidase
VTDLTSLPRWDVSEYFPSLDSREYTAAHEQLGAEVSRLGALYDRHDVRGGPHQLDDAAVAAYDEVLDATNAVREQAGLLQAYAYAFVSTDATDAEAQRAYSRLEREGAELTKLGARFEAWIASLGADDLIERSEAAASHAWPMRKAETRADHQMSEAEEDLSADLSLTGGSAWSRLYRDVTASISVEVPMPDGTVETLPMSGVRGLAGDPDRAVREAAHHAELEAWEVHATPIAAALNAIKGEQLTLANRRRWDSPLDAQLFGQTVDRETLSAMQRAMTDSFDDFRRYLQAKAKLMGLDRLAFFDLFAPIGGGSDQTWTAAAEAVDAAFSSYSPQLRALARRAFDESWVDAGPRSGKVGGAFCMPTIDGDSRVLMNFNGSFDSFQTLAHELGHAYHNSTMAGRTPLQKGTPSALAETASIFCETIMVSHGLETATGDDRLAILEVDLQGSLQVIVDIHSRFLFEAAVFEQRASSTLSTDELCGLMAEAQEATYGDGLDADLRHPWMWAAKPHYYGSLFYNWPYAYGLLFGLGLFAEYEREPDRFRQGYDDLLSSTGLGTAAELAERFGIDVRDVGFWNSSLDVVRGRIDAFCDEVETRVGP